MLGVVKVVVLVAKAVPPVAAAYQSIWSFTPAFAVSVTVPAPHLKPPTTFTVAELPPTVAVTATLLAAKQPVVVFLASA